MTNNVSLRDVTDDDLPIFFEQLQDPVSKQMAAFGPKGPADRERYAAHWTRIRGEPGAAAKTVLLDGIVAGHLLACAQFGERSICYWFAREYWGQGVATAALAAFLAEYSERPLHARAALDNRASIRVLEKCGFVIAGQERAFANARGEEIEEVFMVLK